MNDARIYLCKTDGSILGIPTGLKTDTCNLKRNITDFWEISFEVERFINVDGNLVQSDFYDSIDDSMRLYLDSDTIQAYFIIDSEPTIKGEGYQEIKTVTAHSVECELNHIYLKNFKINCGTYDSQEFLVTDDNGNLVNNINAYNANTMRWIKLVDYEDTRYSLMHLVLENTDWIVKDDIPEDICNIQKTYETSNSIYSFLMKVVSPTAHVIFEFDRKHKQIGIVKLEEYGKDTGVFVTMRNLMNSFEVTSSADDAIMTKLIPVGADNLSIEQVNFGESHIINLDYFMNTLNEYSDYKFVSKDLHDKYVAWRNFRDGELVQYTFKEPDLLTGRKKEDINFEGTRRELYREITKEYNGIYGKIGEITNRVPNDGCNIDYKKFTLEELKTSLTAYNNALDALLTLYKNEIIEEYGLDKNTIITVNDDYSLSYSPVPSTTISPTLLPNSPYWYDYYAYEYKIIPQVKESLKMYCKTDSNGNLMVDSNGHYIELEYGNPDYYKDTTIITDVDAWRYEWSLYGLSELESKKKAWGEVASLLHKDCFEISKGVYLEPDDDSWNSLSDSDKTLFTSKDAFLSDLNKYLDYVSYDETRDNSLTKQKGKGIIRQCEDAIADRLSEIEKLAKLQDDYDTDRKELVKSVVMRKFFTDEDVLIINGILRTKDYENSNILTTNLNTIITTVDVQEELYQEAIKELDKISQPQYSFKTELDNLYYLEEFKAYREPFDVGNFIRVGLEIHEDLYDNNYIKLRVISISHNPLEYTEDLSIEFSTMTKSLNTISDLAFFLDEQNSVSSGGGSSTSSGGGTYGNNDASVQMSTTMLNALLKTETFGTAVSDVILDTMKANKGNFNSLFAHSGVFDSLEAGQIKVSGDCLFDYVKSSNWNGTNGLLSNTQGSAMDLHDGKFNFAGGKLKWDGSKLSVTGDIVANSLTLGENANVDISVDNLTDANKLIFKDLGIGNKSESYNSDYTKGYFNVSNNGLLTAENAIIYGTIFASNGKFTGEVQATSGKFTGEVNATSGSFNGNVTATSLTANQSGSIAGWNFNSNAFYKNSSEFGNANGVYLGTDGFSFKDIFKIDSNSLRLQNNGNVKRIYSAGLMLGYDELEDGDYVIVWLNNIKDGELVDIRFQADRHKLQPDGNGNVNSDYDIGNTDNGKYKIQYNSKTGIKFTCSYNSMSDFTWYIDENHRIANVWLKKVYTGYWTGTQGVVNGNSNHYYREIKKIEFYNSSNICYKTYYNPNVSLNINERNMSLDTNIGELETSAYSLTSKAILGYSDIFNIKIYPISNEGSSVDNADLQLYTELVSLNINDFQHKGVYNSTISSNANIVIDSDGFFKRSSSSSQRYKNSITPIDKTSKSLSDLSPHNLYDIDVVSFKYNDDYLSSTDQRYQKDITGFIAEDVYEKYPIACNLDNEGNPEMWNIDIMFPAALKLIQEQHEDIEKLKEEIEKLKNDT